jgi:hypothetical protein
VFVVTVPAGLLLCGIEAAGITPVLGVMTPAPGTVDEPGVVPEVTPGLEGPAPWLPGVPAWLPAVVGALLPYPVEVGWPAPLAAMGGLPPPTTIDAGTPGMDPPGIGISPVGGWDVPLPGPPFSPGGLPVAPFSPPGVPPPGPPPTVPPFDPPGVLPLDPGPPVGGIEVPLHTVSTLPDDAVPRETDTGSAAVTEPLTPPPRSRPRGAHDVPTPTPAPAVTPVLGTLVSVQPQSLFPL